MEKIMYCLMFSKLEAVVSPRTTEAVQGLGMGTTPHASRTSVPLLQKLGRWVCRLQQPWMRTWRKWKRKTGPEQMQTCLFLYFRCLKSLTFAWREGLMMFMLLMEWDYRLYSGPSQHQAHTSVCGSVQAWWVGQAACHQGERIWKPWGVWARHQKSHSNSHDQRCHLTKFPSHGFKVIKRNLVSNI